MVTRSTSGTPPTLAETALRITQGGSFNRSMGDFLDAFYRFPQERQRMIYLRPAFTGNEQHDAYFAAVAEHLARTWDLDIPRWTQDPKRYLSRPFFLTNASMADTPLAFRKRMIYTPAEPLRRRTMPPLPA